MYKIQTFKVRLIRDGVLSLAEEQADCFENARDILFALLADLPHEEVHAVMVDGRSNVIGTVRLSMGGLHGCALTARDVLRPIIAQGAAAFILGHNHPSGDPMPSADDRAMTDHIAKCADLIGTPLLDHIVVCPRQRKAHSIMGHSV